jgi:HPt (histidine-containing phosphotransfer) domain-containing protein
METQPAFDKEGAMARVDNDTDLYKELLVILFAEYDQNVQKIGAAIDAKSGQELREQAHSIKSALGNVGAMRAYAAAYELEKAGKASEFGASLAIFEELKAAVVAFKAAVTADPSFSGWQQ